MSYLVLGAAAQILISSIVSVVLAYWDSNSFIRADRTVAHVILGQLWFLFLPFVLFRLLVIAPISFMVRLVKENF